MKQNKYMPVVLLLATLFLVAMVSRNDDGNLQDISDSMGVEQYAERYGISENEALDRMSLQSDLALIGEEIFKNEWEHVGGIWFEHDPEFTYTIAVTGNRDQIRAYFDDQRLLEYVTIVDVDISLSDLQELLELTNQIAANFETNHSTAIIQRNQQIEIRAVSKHDFLEEFGRGINLLSLQERQLLEKYVVIVEDEAVDDLSSTAAIFAGHNIFCTSGWNVTYNGARYATTAGHCPNTLYYDGQYLGNVIWEANPDVSGVYHTDLQLHNATAQGHTLSNDFHWSNKVVAQISKWGTEGSWVCKIGRTTSVTCGNIDSVTANWGPGQPNTLIRVTRHDSANPLACGGDSGSPLYSWQSYGFAANGWVIGSPCQSYGSNYMLAMPVNTAWSHGIHVLTVP